MSDQLRATAVLTRCTDFTEVVLSFSLFERCFDGKQNSVVRSTARHFVDTVSPVYCESKSAKLKAIIENFRPNSPKEA